MKNRIDVLEISLYNIHKAEQRFGEPGIYIDCIYFMQCPVTHNFNSNPVRAQMTLHQGIERDFVGVIMPVVSRLRMLM